MLSTPDLFIGNYLKTTQTLNTTMPLKQSRWVYERGGLKDEKKKMKVDFFEPTHSLFTVS